MGEEIKYILTLSLIVIFLLGNILFFKWISKIKLAPDSDENKD